MVPLDQKECPTSLKHKEAWMEENPEKMKITVFRSWELHDGEKNDLLRIECIRSITKMNQMLVSSVQLRPRKTQ